MKKILLPITVASRGSSFFSTFIVKEVNQAIVLQFGDPKKIILEPGLNFKIPFIQNVVFLDSRILNLDTPPAEVIASDQKRLIVDAFARFQIVDPLKFYISVGNERVARSRLATIIGNKIFCTFINLSLSFYLVQVVVSKALHLSLNFYQ